MSVHTEAVPAGLDGSVIGILGGTGRRAAGWPSGSPRAATRSSSAPGRAERAPTVAAELGRLCAGPTTPTAPGGATS